jgi:hypothetical protein
MSELTPEALAALPEDDLLANIEATKRRIAELNDSLQAYLDDLSRRVEAGHLDPAFTHNDWSFCLSAGRRSWEYPEAVKTAEASLKAAKKAAEGDGSATPRTGSPFWTIRSPQP